MPLERTGDTGPDLLEGCRGFRNECLEIHVASPLATVAAATFRRGRWVASDRIVGSRLVNGALKLEPLPCIGRPVLRGGLPGRARADGRVAAQRFSITRLWTARPK